MTLTKKGYLPRIADAKIEQLMASFGAICVEGPKWCGKTWTTLNHAESVYYVADPALNYQNRQLASIDPSRALSGKEPHAIDEWQEIPGIWDAVRFEVDQQQNRGRFILTGSIMPPKQATAHSGVGRIARLRMRPMTLYESGHTSDEVSFSRLVFGDSFPPRSTLCQIETSIDEIANFTSRGGWPDTRGLSLNAALELPRQYISETANTDMSLVDGIPRDPLKVGALLRSLARNNQTMVRNSTLAKDIGLYAEAGISVSAPTVQSYLDALGRLYVIEEIPVWNPNMRSSKRIKTAPKRHFVDPSLAVAALGATPEKLISDLNTFGFLFETLVARDIKVYAEALGAMTYHYNDDSGLKVDLVVEMQDGSWSAFEVKLGASQADEAAASLIRLKSKMLKSGVKAPNCLAVICGVSRFGYVRDDSVVVLPITALKA